MKRSMERMLTTHVGSLPRPTQLLDVMREKENDRPYDHDEFARLVREAVAGVVRKQAECGLDVVTDGEMGKVTFATYFNERLSGFEPRGETYSTRVGSWSLEAAAFPDYYADYFQKYRSTVSQLRPLVCTGPVGYTGQAAVRTDIENLNSALAQVDVQEAFMPATIPLVIGDNQYYSSEDDLREAVTEAMREEYRAILDAGLVLQIDDPGLIEILNEDPARPIEERRRRAAAHVEEVNHALRGLATERIRVHVCYGLNSGPRVHDASFAEVAPFMLRINAGAYSFEFANPRHMHEWKVWEHTRLPDDKVLIPGMISHGHSFVEHPELIADLLETFARLVGRENVIAGADCGFSSRATYKPEVPPSVVWAKFESLAEGARLATQRLWAAPATDWR
ncbi:MAG TPA: cobalamin-independent methionine synthase II family protein [Chloroflexota bacterium]|nr:cobalamin-independent methionine synthase II family protein [Chloroflexota bacterium]